MEKNEMIVTDSYIPLTITRFAALTTLVYNRYVSIHLCNAGEKKEKLKKSSNFRRDQLITYRRR